MDREIALKWAEALESGLYEQTHGQLRDHFGFCCLGVLCNLHAQAHPEIAAKQKNIFSYMGEEVELPAKVRKWGGLNDKIGTFFLKDGVVESLVVLNDDAKLSFKEIAKVIRKHYEKL